MKRIQVDSSNLKTIAYDEERKVLEIGFKDGSFYEYYDVPATVYRELLSAESKGSYAHKNIYKKYKQAKL